MTERKPPSDIPGGATATRGVVGGVLMGLANLVPGISGGTMLLAVGIYPQFIRSVAEVSMFRFSWKAILLLSCVAGGLLVAVFALAGVVGELGVGHRWVMYSLFIGLTLGGVPVLWRLLGRADSTVVVASVVGIAAMAALAAVDPGSSASAASGERAYAMLFLAGIAGASAMILPGLSGAYVLLVLGQYVALLSAVEAIRSGVSGRDWAAVGEALHVFIPILVGVCVGIVGVSNLIRLLLDRFERATLGFLLGLLLGAVLGLWPYREAVEPIVGDVIKGIELTMPEMVAEVEPGDWPTRLFRPCGLQIGGSLLLVVAGFGLSAAVSHLGQPQRRISDGR